MLKRMLVIICVLGIAAGLFSSSALAGPPWPAEVFQIREGEFCYFTWLDENFQGITLTGPGIWVAQYHNGRVQWNCHTIIDFSDPNIASLDQVCDFVEGAGLDLCKGNGSFVWSTAYEPLPMSCSAGDANGNVYYSDNALYIVTPNGNVNITCHFDMSP